jgi:hypothetical protein
MFRSLILAIGLALVPITVFAENSVPFPDYSDPNITCQAYRNSDAVNQCLSKNQQGYDEAKLLWPELNQSSAEHCAGLPLGKSPLGYEVLAGC